MSSNLKTDLQIPQQYDELDDTQITVLQSVQARRSVEEIAEKIGEKQATVYRYLNGLRGKTNGIPKKYHVENQYLEKLPAHNDLAIKFRLTTAGLKVVGEYDLPSKSANGNENTVSESSESGAEIRPHYLISKHQIRKKPQGWENLDTYLAEKEITYDDEVDRELPDGSTVSGRAVFYEGHKVEVYSKTVVIRLDFPAQSETVKSFFNKIQEKRKEVIAWVERKFSPIQVRSHPENIEASLSAQHWAEVRNDFAVYVENNPELWENELYGQKWVVNNELDDRVAVIDCSHGEPELEFMETQEAKNHMDNIKDLLLWGAYYDITPDDFSHLKWLRDNKGVFDDLFDKFEELEEMQEQVSENTENIQRNQDGIRELAGSMVSEFQSQGERIQETEDQLQGISQQVMQVSRVNGDLVNRTMQNQMFLSQQSEYNHNVRELLSDHQGDLKYQQEMLSEQREMNGNVQELLQSHQETIHSHEELIEQQQEMIKELRNSRYSVRAKKTIGKVKEKAQETVNAVKERLGGLL